MGKKIKVVWLSNVAFSNMEIQSTGTWLIAMGQALLSNSTIELHNIAQSNKCIYKKESIGSLTQYYVPIEKLKRNGLPSSKTIKFIVEIIKEINPDIIHVWGTENYWGLLTARNFIKGVVLLEIQGLKYLVAKVYYGNLTLFELLKSINLKEILKPTTSLFAGKYRLYKWGKYEKEMIKAHENIATPSDWISFHVSLINKKCRKYRSGMILRKEFTESIQWDRKDVQDLVIFSSSNVAHAYKGLHVLFKSLFILKKKYPSIILKIAGNHILSGIKTKGYLKFLKNEAKNLGINESIKWLGPLNSKEIVCQLRSSHVNVIPSFVESYSMTLAEAMMVGTPTVVAFSGAMPELAHHCESALFYTATDEVMCAMQIEKILKDKELAERLSDNARTIGLKRHDAKAIISKQLKIYEELIRTK